MSDMTQNADTKRRSPKPLAALLALAVAGIVALVVGLGSGGGTSGHAAPLRAAAARQVPAVSKPVTHPAAPPAPAANTTNPIPQNNGGDADPDNNGGPSDGDGNI